jgi:hypothetical protein
MNFPLSGAERVLNYGAKLYLYSNLALPLIKHFQAATLFFGLTFCRQGYLIHTTFGLECQGLRSNLRNIPHSLGWNSVKHFRLLILALAINIHILCKKTFLCCWGLILQILGFGRQRHSA